MRIMGLKAASTVRKGALRNDSWCERRQNPSSLPGVLCHSHRELQFANCLYRGLDPKRVENEFLGRKLQRNGKGVIFLQKVYI